MNNQDNNAHDRLMTQIHSLQRHYFSELGGMFNAPDTHVGSVCEVDSSPAPMCRDLSTFPGAFNTQKISFRNTTALISSAQSR